MEGRAGKDCLRAGQGSGQGYGGQGGRGRGQTDRGRGQRGFVATTAAGEPREL